MRKVLIVVLVLCSVVGFFGCSVANKNVGVESGANEDVADVENNEAERPGNIIVGSQLVTRPSDIFFKEVLSGNLVKATVKKVSVVDGVSSGESKRYIYANSGKKLVDVEVEFFNKSDMTISIYSRNSQLFIGDIPYQYARRYGETVKEIRVDEVESQKPVIFHLVFEVDSYLTAMISDDWVLDLRALVFKPGSQIKGFVSTYLDKDQKKEEIRLNDFLEPPKLR